MRESADQYFASIPGTAMRYSAERALWRMRDGHRVAVDPWEADALELCAGFDSISEHARRLSQQLRLAPSAAERLVGTLVSRKLVRPLSAFLPAAHGSSAASLAQPLVVIRSFERPQGLERLLASLLADERRFDARRRYLVVDDSPAVERDAEARALVRGFAQQSGSEVRYLGHHEREAAMAHALVGVAPQARAGALPLLSPHHPSAVTGSRSWNWAVLAAAGGALSILDDDVSFPLREPENTSVAFDLAPSLSVNTRYYDDHSFRELVPLPHEPYAWLARYAGQRPGALLARDGCDASTARGYAAAALHEWFDDAPVIGAIPGIYGAIPFGSSAYLTATDPASNAHLWREPFRLERLDADRIWNGVRAPRLVPEAVYTPLLLDARALLPFAGTWGRVDDQYFLMLLRAIAAPIQFALVPALLGHEDPAPRARRERALQPLLLDRNAWLASIFGPAAAGLAGGGREARLAAVGTHCGALASLDDHELERRILAWRGHMMLQLVAHLNHSLAQHREAPVAWRTQVQGIIAANEAALANETSAPQEIARCRAGLQQVESAAQQWPAIWKRCAAEPLWERLPVP